MGYEFIDLWTESQDWSLRPVCRLRAASEPIWRISHKKPVSQMLPRLNVEISLFYIYVYVGITIIVLKASYKGQQSHAIEITGLIINHIVK